MRARFVMDKDVLTAHPGESVMVAQWRLSISPHRILYAIDTNGRYLGRIFRDDLSAVNVHQLLEQVMEPADETPTMGPEDDVAQAATIFQAHPEWPSLPVVEPVTGDLVGAVSRSTLEAPREPDPRYVEALADGRLQTHLVNALNSGLLVVDAHGIVRLVNPAGADILGIDADAVVGQPYEEVAQLLVPHMVDYLRTSAIPLVLAGGASRGEREFVIHNGRTIRFAFGAIREEAALLAIAVTFIDVSALRVAQQMADDKAREAEMAFGLTLPNTKVEAKLKASPEYQDVYDAATGIATVTAVIPDGTYWHVVNGLRIMAELKACGVFGLVGLDKDTLVQAFIFHDLGKEQPRLAVGQTFVPTETFEPGYRHAARSADWAVKEYHVSDDVAWLIRYHHTSEDALPAGFPEALKPMWRLLRLVDGLSAGMTRRQAAVAPIVRDGTVLTIREVNGDARYHRSYTLSIYSGEERRLPG